MMHDARRSHLVLRRKCILVEVTLFWIANLKPGILFARIQAANTGGFSKTCIKCFILKCLSCRVRYLWVPTRFLMKFVLDDKYKHKVTGFCVFAVQQHKGLQTGLHRTTQLSRELTPCIPSRSVNLLNNFVRWILFNLF